MPDASGESCRTPGTSSVALPLTDGTRSRRLLRPEFLQSKRIKLAVATSGYCNARCDSCVWPFMENDTRIMSNTDFARLLEMFRGYRIDKFAFNVINEPFVDKRIGEKLDQLAESGLRVKNLFFSSNWLIPSPVAVDEFAQAVVRAAAVPQIKRIAIGATVCGVDQISYDRHQGGRGLQGTVAAYRHLDFDRAVGAVIRFMRSLREHGWPSKVVFNCKAYGATLDHETYAAFWRRRLQQEGLEDTLDGQVQILFNHAFTTFARQAESASGTGRGVCRTHWLDARLAVGPGGDIGLCCEEGLQGVRLGNIFEHGLAGVTGTARYQQYLAEVLGHDPAGQGSPCRRCQFFETVGESPAAASS